MMTKVTILGTSHIASQSVKQIKQAFKELNPDLVAVELDKERAENIFKKQELPGVREIFNIGLTGYLFVLLGSAVQRGLGARVGLNAGEDMRTALSEAKKANLPIYFIDLPLKQTLQNITKSMTRWEKTKMILYMFGSVFPATVSLLKGTKEKLDLTKVPEGALIKAVLRKIKKHFPGFYDALITKRNNNMITAIKYISSQNPDKHILVVVGAGHADDLKAALENFY